MGTKRSVGDIRTHLGRLEKHLARMEERRSRDERFNRTAYAEAREMSGWLSIYRYGSGALKDLAEKAILLW